MRAHEALAEAGISNRRLAVLFTERTGTSMSKTTAQRAVRCGLYPTRFGDVKRFQSVVEGILAEHGISGEIEWHGQRKRMHGEKCEVIGRPFDIWAGERATEIREMELMQLSEEVLALFRLKKNPFENDVRSDTDVFRPKESGYAKVEREIRRGIKERSMLALIAPSGSGKTTLWDGIEDELINREDVVLCKPMAPDREQLRPTHLARALLASLLGRGAKIAGDINSMGTQLYEALKAAQDQSRTVVLYIDDAHFVNRTLLRQIKTFYEYKVGHRRLLAIVMIGINELGEKLGRFREVGDRTRTLTMPLVPVEKYLEFKLNRVGSGLSKLFDTEGLKAFKERFQAAKGKHSVGRPLAINAACIRCMVALEENEAVAGERITRAIVDGVSAGQARARRVA